MNAAGGATESLDAAVRAGPAAVPDRMADAVGETEERGLRVDRPAGLRKVAETR